MKEPYGEGLATHTGPESCVWQPRGCRRSVDRGTCGLGIEPRKDMHPRRRPCGTMGKATRAGAPWRAPDPALRGRRTPCTHGNSLHGNREISRPAILGMGWSASGRPEGPKPMTHGREKSDSPIVPGKPTNKAGRPAAEPVEGRGGAKGNADLQSTHRTQRRASVSQAQARVRTANRIGVVVIHPRQEPGALAAHAGICAGGAG